jgi:predicted DNA-binding transcriptional regulator YafY
LIARKFLRDISNGYIGEEISTTVEKITTILKKHMPEEDIIDNALSFQLIEYSPAPQEVVKVVLEGCLKKRSLSFTYYSPVNDEKSMRTVDPYHILNYMGTWYLIAYCHTKKDIRDFHLGRISNLRILDDIFIIKRDFDIKEHLNSAFGIYKGKTIKQVTLRFSPLKARWISGQIWHKDQKAKLLKDGSLELTFPVANYGEIMMEILRHGSGVEVIKPKSLRELIKTEARKIAKIY